MELTAEHRDEIGRFARERGWLSSDPVAASVAGEGNMNRTLRLTTPTESIVLKQSVPYVAKYPDIPAPEDRDQVEAAFYEAIAGTPLAHRMPAFLGHAPEHHVLAFEDLGEAADCTDAYDGAALTDDLAPLAAWARGLHAIDFEAGRFRNREMRALNHAHIFEIPFDDHGSAEVTAQASRLGEVYLADGDTLLHGDYYPGSWLRTQGGVRIIDPEFAFAGPPEFDMGVLLAHLVFTGNLDKADDVLATYAPGPDFDRPLAYGFAGVEVLRRIWGVAKLPFSRDTAPDEAAWISWAETQVLES